MPIYMDRHDVSDDVTAENVAHLHQADLKIQDQYSCRGLTYWFDDKRKTAFCLVEAPNEESIKKMHHHAHGQIPHHIIEVDDSVVESFLGRIEDPKKSKKSELNIINDPAFRTIMAIGIKPLLLNDSILPLTDLLNHHGFIAKSMTKFKGSIAVNKADHFLVSFSSVTNAVKCALDVQKNLAASLAKKKGSSMDFGIGLSAGVPVTNKSEFFVDTIIKAELFSTVVKGQLVLSHEVKDLYESETSDSVLNSKSIRSLTSSEETFLIQLMEFIETDWKDTNLNIDRLVKGLGISKSNLNRKMIILTGKSPNNFIQEYRLNKALKFLVNQTGTVSEIGFQTGFNSPAYFTKVFRKRFGVLPTAINKNNSKPK